MQGLSFLLPQVCWIQTNAFGNIKGFTQDGFKYGAIGFLNTVWDDGGGAFWGNDWLGVSYGAEKGWGPYSTDSTFEYRLNHGVYAAKEDNYTEAIWKIEELAALEPTDGMNDKEQQVLQSSR